MKLELRYLSFLMTAVVLASGCGQNPHVTAEDAQVAASNPDASFKKQEASLQPQTSGPTGPSGLGTEGSTGPTGISTEGATGPTGSSGLSTDGATGPTGASGLDGNKGKNGGLGENGNNGDQGNNGKNGHNGDNGDQGNNGKNGRDGKDGQDGKTIIIEKTVIVQGEKGKDGCGPSNKAEPGILKSLNPESLQALRESNGKSLPYFLQHPKNRFIKVGLLTLGEGNKGSNASRYVNDAQVVFDVQLTLPSRKLIRTDQPLSANLTLNFYKKSVDTYPETEIICLQNKQICSGTEFKSKDWMSLINPEFGRGKPVINDQFSKQLLIAIKAEKTRVGGHHEWDGNLTLDLAELFSKEGRKLSNEELLDVLYSGANATEASTGYIQSTLRFIVADDTKVTALGNSGLIVNYVVDTCGFAQENAVGGGK